MIPFLICLLCLTGGCLWWLFRRCIHSGATASKDWPPATYDEFKDVPRVCRILLSVYEEDINNPVYNDRLEIKDVARLAGYKETEGKCPPYVIYVDHAAKDICLAVRGLNMGNFADYKVLMDNRIGKQRFDGGYVHHGLLKSAAWLLDREMETLNGLAADNPDYTVTFAGHSLGSGIVAMMTVILHKNPLEVGFHLVRLRCFCIAPARSTSLNLAIKYADIINSVVLQDDFLPRTSAPIDNILALSFCLPCMLCVKCCWDTCGLYKRRVKDPRRLYAPGRLFHILYTSDFSCKEEEPQVKTAVPVEDRFEKVVLSRTAIDDHSIVVIERRSTAAVESLEVREEVAESKVAPGRQRMQRSATMKERKEEYARALERALTLHVPDAATPEEIRLLVAAAEEREDGGSGGGLLGWKGGEKREKGEQGEGRENSETVPLPAAAGAAAAGQAAAGAAAAGAAGAAAAAAAAAAAGAGVSAAKAVGVEREAGRVGVGSGEERKGEEEEGGSERSETLSEFWRKELEEFREKERQALLDEERHAEERLRRFEEQRRDELSRLEAEGREDGGEEADRLSHLWDGELAALRRKEEQAALEREAQAAERIRAFEERRRAERERRAQQEEAEERLEGKGREGEGHVVVAVKEGDDDTATTPAATPPAATPPAATPPAATVPAATAPAASAAAAAGTAGEVVVRVDEGAGGGATEEGKKQEKPGSGETEGKTEVGGTADMAIQVDEGPMLDKAATAAVVVPAAATAATVAAPAATKAAGAEAAVTCAAPQGARTSEPSKAEPQGEQQQWQQQQAQLGRGLRGGSEGQRQAVASARQKWERIVDELIDTGEGDQHTGARDAAEAQLREVQRFSKQQWHKARSAFLSGVGSLSKKAGMGIEI
ncbi:hypothetical protein CLOM_g3313 [Closterium sp. NIES-68]|nr:hypothetical protein CLOM_g3313 [Closterium sp. NIES-68]GJP67624.1 hypothetical protein CLOP_g24421 [Closterium sp. NIES-67]